MSEIPEEMKKVNTLQEHGAKFVKCTIRMLKRTKSPDVICSIPFRKLQCQRCISFWPKSRGNFATDKARRTRKPIRNNGGIKRQPSDSLESFE